MIEDVLDIAQVVGDVEARLWIEHVAVVPEDRRPRDDDDDEDREGKPTQNDAPGLRIIFFRRCSRKATAATIHEEIKAEVEELAAKHSLVPGLATVLVGEDPASQSYVRSKQKRCAEVGITSFGHELPESASQEEVEGLVRELTDNPEVHGTLS